MSVLPMIPVDDLAYAVKWAEAQERAHHEACAMCEPGDPHPACVTGMSFIGSVLQAQWRLDAAVSQQPDRHIRTGGAAYRRVERDRMLEAA